MAISRESSERTKVQNGQDGGVEGEEAAFEQVDETSLRRPVPQI